MIDWKWTTEADGDHGGLFWDTDLMNSGKGLWLHVNGFTSAKAIGRRIILITKGISPLQTQLYRLVYGSLP